MAAQQLPPEQVIFDVIFDYLFPTVEKEVKAVTIERSNTKFAKAANDALSSIVNKLETVFRVH
jgi:hypothetical protein